MLLNCGEKYQRYYPGAMEVRKQQAEGRETEERRRRSRISLQIPVFLRGLDARGEEFLDLIKTLNISAYGACLATPRPLQMQQVVALRIPAPTSPSPGHPAEATPAISARVVRGQPMGDMHLVGVEFLKPLE